MLRDGDSLTSFADDCLADRHILVTGASSGIGQATAAHLARYGARLSLVARDPERLDQTRRDLAGDGHSVHRIDLEGADAAADAVSKIASECGAFDGIFYSAGATMVLPIRLLKDKHLDEAFGAGVYGAFGVVKAAARKGVMKDGSSIVVMSSAAALRGRPALSAYCAAKAAVDAMVRCAALEFAPRKVRVNSIRAAAVETAMHDEYMASIGPEAKRDYDERHPLGYGKPEDIANAVLFLLSDASPWISGENWAVDGAAAAK
jgi:NAD(P)-dependent dehydrogenase (short-subunit alcohol dehydrogenase family)